MSSLEFPIKVVIDPRTARPGARAISRELETMEREARELNNALRAALSQRDRGTAMALGRIENVLERTEQRAIITDTRIGQIGRDINDRGVRRFNDRLKKTDETAKKLRRTLRRAFAGIGVALVVRQVIRLTDEFTIMQNRLATVIDDQRELESSFSSLAKIANETRTEIGSIVTLYQRGSAAAEDLGASNAKLLLFVERVGQGLAVQGTSAAMASGALLQLSQALGAGIVRAEEFNSIMEGARPIVAAAARGIERAGGSVSKLRQLIIKGEITSREFFEGFLAGSEKLKEQFEATTSTIGGAFTVLRNNLILTIGSFNQATGFSKGLSEAILVLGNNIQTVAVAVGFLATALGARLAAKAIPAAIAAIVSLKGAVLATAGVIGGAAVLAVVKFNNVLQSTRDEVAKLNQIFDDLEADAPFGTIGTQIRVAQQEIRNINNLLKQQDQVQLSLSKGQLTQIAKLEARIASLKGTVREQSDETRNQAREVIAAAEAQKQQEEVTKRQKELLESILAPAKNYAILQEDLSVLLKANSISQDQLNDAVSRAQSQFEKRTAPAQDPFEKQLVSIRKQNEALEIKADNQGVIRRELLIELALREKAKGLTDTQREVLFGVLIAQQDLVDAAERKKAVDDQIIALQQRNEELAIKAKDISKEQVEIEIFKLRLKQMGFNLSQKEKAALEAIRLEQERINDVTAQNNRLRSLSAQINETGRLAQETDDLIALYEREPELAVEIDRAFEDVRLRQLEGAMDLQSGFQRAFIKIKQEAEDLAAVGEAVVNVFADNATDALTEFARTGQFNFKQFAASILDDLTRIIARLLVVQALNAAFGGAGTTGTLTTAGLNAGAQGGAIVQPGQAPRPVGERGPEIFQPNVTGTIVPMQPAAAQLPPEINQQIVVVESEDLVPTALASGDSDDVLVVRIGANADRIKQVLG